MPVSSPPIFHPDSAQGSLRRVDGQRVAALSVEWVHALHFALLEQFTDNAQDVLYRSGYDWGLQDMVRLNQHLHTKIGGGNFDLWQLDPKFILDSWWAPLAEAGWGRCTFDLVAVSRGIVFVDLQGSVIAAALAGSDQPVCHFYAGLFAGALSFFERAERHAVEVQCSGLGAATCLFVIGPGAEVDAAETWRQQGVAAAEILRRLR